MLLLVQHHSITDGLSLSAFIGELVVAYNAVLAGTAPQWDPLPIQCEQHSPLASTAGCCTISRSHSTPAEAC